MGGARAATLGELHNLSNRSPTHIELAYDKSQSESQAPHPDRHRCWCDQHTYRGTKRVEAARVVA